MRILFLFLLILTLSACSKSNEFTSSENNEETFNEQDSLYWLVNKELIIGNSEVYPEIDSIHFFSAHEFPIKISDFHRVAMINIQNDNYVFLFGDLSYFETMNFTIHSDNYSITHCPITNTTLVFKHDKKHKIRASGYRYKDNLIYLNSTNQNLTSQMLETTIGYYNKLNSTPITSIPIIDTEWKTIKNYFNDIKIAFVQDNNLGTFTKNRVYENQNTLNWNQTSLSFNNNKIKHSIEILNLQKIDTDLFNFTSNNLSILGIKSKKITRIFPSSYQLNFSDDGNYLFDKNQNKYNWNGYCFDGINKGNSINIVNGYTGSTSAFYSIFKNVKSIN